MHKDVTNMAGTPNRKTAYLLPLKPSPETSNHKQYSTCINWQ